MKDTQIFDKKQKKDLWKNRRAMAWRSFYGAMIYLTFVALFVSFASVERIKAFSELGSFSLTVFGFFGTIIAAYIGASTYHDVKLGNKQEE